MNRPASVLSSSIARWCGLPAPAEAYEKLPGLALAWAMKVLASAMPLAGLTTRIIGKRPISVTGARSLVGLYDSDL